MRISAEDIKELRASTSCGVSDCKKALEEALGDIKKAKEFLKKRGLEIAARKQGRETKEGRLEAYIHPGSKLAALVEVNCETDFVARNEDFCQFTKDVAMHIAAMNPRYIRREDIPLESLKEHLDQEALIKEVCLLEQAFIKDTSITIKEYLNSLIAKIGENIFISRFVRYKVSEI